MTQKTTYLSLDGEIVPWEAARVHMLTPAFKYGACAFEGIRAYSAAEGDEVNVFRLAEHLDRLAFTMKVMRFDSPPDAARMTEALLALIRANGIRADMHVRLLAWVDGDGEQTATGPVGWGIAALPRKPNPRVANGVHVGVSSWTRTADNAMPNRLKVTANYNNGRLSGLQGRADGYDNVILLTQAGHVSESPSSCLFVLRDGVPTTPSVTSDILESVTRATAIDLFRTQMGLVTSERAIGRTELYAAQEAFFCGSGGEIQPILSIDRLPVGTGQVGPVTRRLQDAYFRLVRGGTDARREWLTPVFGS